MTQNSESGGLFDGFSIGALEAILLAVETNESQTKENIVEEDLYSGCTNLHSVLEDGDEWPTHE